MNENEYRFWQLCYPSEAGHEIYTLQKDDGVPFEHISLPADDAQVHGTMKRYNAIAAAMDITEAPHLIVIEDAWWPFTHTAHFKPGTNTITITRKTWEDFATEKPGTAADYIIRHELGHAADKKPGLNRRTFLGGLLAGAIRPTAALGSAAVAIKAGDTLHGDTTPHHTLVVGSEASAGGAIGHKAVTPLAKWAIGRNHSYRTHVEEITADRHASTDKDPIETIRGILAHALSQESTKITKDYAERSLSIRAHVGGMATTLQERYPILSAEDAQSTALLKYHYERHRPDLRKRLSTDPKENGDYPSGYERIMALLENTRTQSRGR